MRITGILWSFLNPIIEIRRRERGHMLTRTLFLFFLLIPSLFLLNSWKLLVSIPVLIRSQLCRAKGLQCTEFKDTEESESSQTFRDHVTLTEEDKLMSCLLAWSSLPTQWQRRENTNKVLLITMEQLFCLGKPRLNITPSFSVHTIHSNSPFPSVSLSEMMNFQLRTFFCI